MADTDRLLGFLLPRRAARGRLVRLGPVLREVLEAHSYPETVARLLAEALALTALFGALLRPEEGQVTLQVQPGAGSRGPLSLLVADYLDGALRGYIEVDPDRRIAPDADLPALFGDARLVITLDQSVSAERYQGIVPLEGASLAAAAEAYFAQSEQIPTVVRLVARRGADGAMVAGGFIVQHLARAEEGGPRLHVEAAPAEQNPGQSPDWNHVEALARTLTDAEMCDPNLALEDLLWRLFHEEEEVRTLDAVALSRGCRCSRDYIQSVLMRFPEAERADMRGQDGLVSVDCAFCSRRFEFQL
jgi:molecular chaperone Hsp33